MLELSMVKNAVSLLCHIPFRDTRAEKGLGCGNSVVNGGGPAPDGNTGCNIACKGNSAEICGGSNRLDVYQYTSSAPVTTPPASSTAPASTASATPVIDSAKRGLQYNNNNPKGNAEWANYFVGYPKIGWGYSYGYDSLGLDSSLEL